jgi:hypothetical protein
MQRVDHPFASGPWCLGAALCTCALATPIGAQQVAPRPGRPPGKVELAPGGATVPMATPGDRPIVEAWINGRGPFKLGVETGNAWAVTLFTDALPRLGSTAPDTSNGAMPHVDSVRVGGLTLRDVDVAIPGPSSLPTQLDGQLGLAAYAELLVTIDFPRHRLGFSRDTLPTADSLNILPVQSVGPILGFPARLASSSGVFILDTQGGVGVSVNPSFPNLSLATPPITVGLVHSPAFGTIPRRMARLGGDLRIGRYTVQRPLVMIAAPPPGLSVDGLIGIHSLKYFRVALDQRTHRVQFARPAPTIPPAPGWWDRGITVRYGRGPLQVLAVVPDTPGARAALAEGDVILEANDRSTAGFAPSDWEPLAQSKTPLRLVVEHNGARRSVTLGSQLLVH